VTYIHFAIGIPKHRPLFERYKRVHASEWAATDVGDRYETKIKLLL